MILWMVCFKYIVIVDDPCSDEINYICLTRKCLCMWITYPSHKKSLYPVLRRLVEYFSFTQSFLWHFFLYHFCKGKRKSSVPWQNGWTALYWIIIKGIFIIVSIFTFYKCLIWEMKRKRCIQCYDDCNLDWWTLKLMLWWSAQHVIDYSAM